MQTTSSPAHLFTIRKRRKRALFKIVLVTRLRMQSIELKRRSKRGRLPLIFMTQQNLPFLIANFSLANDVSTITRSTNHLSRKQLLLEVACPVLRNGESRLMAAGGVSLGWKAVRGVSLGWKFTAWD